MKIVHKRFHAKRVNENIELGEFIELDSKFEDVPIEPTAELLLEASKVGDYNKRQEKLAKVFRKNHEEFIITLQFIVK